eukprot:COSAG01_NODE_1618_length_9716_cov_3.375689_1_plen_1127_part_00
MVILRFDLLRPRLFPPAPPHRHCYAAALSSICTVAPEYKVKEMMMSSLVAAPGGQEEIDQPQASICAHLLRGKLPGWATKSSAEMVQLRKLAVKVALLFISAGILFMLIGTRRVISLDAEDAAYGDGCGCPPPSFRMFENFVNQEDFTNYQQAEKNTSDLACQSKPGAPGHLSKPPWCTPSPSGGNDGGTKKDDGKSCQSSAECEGVCAGKAGSRQCVLSDYSGGLSVYAERTLLLSTMFYCILSLGVLVVLTSHRNYFPAVWKVGILFVTAAGAIFMYSWQAQAGNRGGVLKMDSALSVPVEFAEPIFGFYFLFSLPPMALAAVWAGALSFIAWIFGLFGSSVSLLGGGCSMIFPVVMSIVAAVALMSHMFGGAGGQDGLVARLSQGVVVQPQISSQRMFRVAHVFGMLGMLAVFNLLWSDTFIWYSLGSMTKFADCSEFSDAELRGVEKLRNFICVDYPKAMTCGGLPDGFAWNGNGHDICQSQSHNVRVRPAEAGGYNTGLAGTTDPLVAQFRHGMWIYKIGLFFITIGFAATIFATTQPEKNTRTATTKHKQQPGRRVFAVQKFSWTVPLAVAGAVSLLAVRRISLFCIYPLFWIDSVDWRHSRCDSVRELSLLLLWLQALLIAIGAHGMFNIGSDDILYGNAAGGRPPLGPLDDYMLWISDVPDVLQKTDFNESLNSGPSEPEKRSKTAGAACSRDVDCVSGICTSKTSRHADGKICVLDDYAEDYGLFGTVDQDIWENQGEAPFWRPVYGSLLVAFAGLLPAEFDGKRVVSPGVAVGMATGSFLITLRAWAAWAFLPGSMVEPQHTWRSIYTSMVDCSDFDENEMIGASLISGYHCYEGPARRESLATFMVTAGTCHLSESGKCVSSPKFPAAYDSSPCTISVSGTAAVAAKAWDIGYSDRLRFGNFDSVQNYFGYSSKPTNEKVTASSTIHWSPQSYGSHSHTGWTICLNKCDTACQSRGNSYGVQAGMSATLSGIQTTDGSLVNPVLRSWVRHCTTFLFGLFLNLVASTAALALAFPLHWPAVKMATDLVCCWGRCYGTVAVPQSEADADAIAGLSLEVVEPLATLEPPQAAQATTAAFMPGQISGMQLQQPPGEPSASSLQFSTESPSAPVGPDNTF